MEFITTKIEGVKLFYLQEIFHEYGSILHMLRSDAPYFRGFGEVYFSFINGGTCKGFKRHLRMMQFLTVPVGEVEFKIKDERANSPSCGMVEHIVLGRNVNYSLLQIPPLLWYGFRGLTPAPSLIVNCTDIPHDKNEIERCLMDFDSI